jgi:hypothetical protein
MPGRFLASSITAILQLAIGQAFAAAPAAEGRLNCPRLKLVSADNAGQQAATQPIWNLRSKPRLRNPCYLQAPKRSHNKTYQEDRPLAYCLCRRPGNFDLIDEMISRPTLVSRDLIERMVGVLDLFLMN